MSMKTDLAELKDRLAGLKDRIEADDQDAITEGLQLKADIETKQAEIEAAEKKADLLGSIGKKESKEDTQMNTDGIKSLDLEYLKSNRGAVSTFVKAYNDLEAMGDNQIITYNQNVVSVQPALGVRDLFAAEAISGNAMTYYKLGTVEGTITTVNEGAAKNRIHVPYTPVTVALEKVAAYLKETDELLSDAAFLESAIRGRGVYEFQRAVENYLVGALMDTSGVQTGQSTITFDNILKAKQDIFADTGYAPDALLINPENMADLLVAKDGTGGTIGQYLLGGPAYGPYGNGGYNNSPKIWGLNVVESSAVPQGVCVVGAFKAAASVVAKAGEGLRVEVSNSDQDDFIKNIITVRIEERMALAVRIPAAFEIVGTEES